ncbi:hypothetical protein GCM10007275_08270 [Jeotgalicoccus coquinae]|uniref:Peptidyl-prolyl cis-trans isomerase n=1 Tax=Jeotgalicoccus coquinae TaxID=709509 RepID=A0A6V7RJQ6_9STAP|nr:hypothetical protein [Jeotgalicoccus coquinae]MBB6422505.1 hypothetical protein [Jeotgalicoccus coquinae]GGE15351.1 hypothetical protein GCM10007275_08270 [Jeotgalicoccus coquinae]CAD2078346.1 hypothetical protein JEOCOQ751_01155 [Jeotgalicoccus coquinae]
MIIQLTGNVRYQITLDPSTWIFDDRKIVLEDLLSQGEDGEEITFNDETEWNRQIIEGETKPPTLKSEKKFKKRELLENSFVISLAPFLEYAEAYEDENAKIVFVHNDGETELLYKDRETFYAHFSNKGKRLHEDGLFDLLVVGDDGIEQERLVYVTKIEFK